MRSPNPKEEALGALAADLLREADEEGPCDALYSPAFERAVTGYVVSGGFASFLPDDRQKQMSYFKDHFQSILAMKPKDMADYFLLYEARCELMAASAACLYEARQRRDRGISLPPAKEKQLRDRLLGAARPFAAAGREAWMGMTLSDAENDLAYAAGRTQYMSLRLARETDERRI